ncbi:aryl-sulfate sulfotransferase [Natronomonas halophila]|uniref:arylsulfotransferase family protein n=1 Tax=Natronomonas halophila TaxID=2747817 RepID=UPI0015B650DD|nr:arylsulfotransferase family protein [Natronomonas halophila]QLD86744.1 aryl-sulfate sulfotransferase [Natronomonas halophila]
MRRRRVLVFGGIILLCLGVLGVLAVTADDTVQTDEGEPYPGETLVTVQAYGWFGNHNGDVFIVDENGDRTWEYQPPNAAVFDGEYLDNGNVMVSYGQRVPNSECPEEYQNTSNHGDHCVKNVVEEIDPETNERVWAYTWYDVFIHWHEVHDADRLDNGETVIIDMGRDRTFTVNQEGNVTWEWSAVEHLDEGSEFWNEHVNGTSRESHDYTGPSQDWSHMNDVDRLENGNYLMSIRNFDVLVEVDPQTNDVVDVIGDPGNHSIMYEQHDPNYLEAHDHVIVADSENNRVVEYDAETMEEVWRYEGPSTSDRLQWPRDADRLPNGDTLIVDSRNFRAIEVDENGDVVWAHDLSERRGIIYDADRIGPNRNLDEEPEDVPAGDNLESRGHSGVVSNTVAFVESWLGFVFPPWFGLPGLLAVLGILLGGLGFAWEGYRDYRDGA